MALEMLRGYLETKEEGGCKKEENLIVPLFRLRGGRG